MRTRLYIALRAPWTGARKLRTLRFIAHGLGSDLCNLRVAALTAASDAQSLPTRRRCRDGITDDRLP